MKVQSQSNSSTTFSSPVESHQATIDASQTELILRSLIDNYNNIYHACLRETVSNAWDTHQAVGQTRPVEVTLPTRLGSGSLIIQDWGEGMSKDFIANVAQSLLKSTKRNDAHATGGWGIGFDIPLGIVSSFMVESNKDGFKNVATITRDGGVISASFMVDNAPTNDSNGTTITIPLDAEVASRYYSSEQVSRVLAGWSKDEVKVVNDTDSNQRLVDVFERCDDGYYALTYDQKSKAGFKGEKAYILVGKVLYPITFGGEIATEWTNIPTVGASDVTMSLSREVIEDKKHNREVFFDTYQRVKNVSKERTQSKHFDTWFDAIDYHSNAIYGDINYVFEQFDVPPRLHASVVLKRGTWGGKNFSVTNRSISVNNQRKMFVHYDTEKAEYATGKSLANRVNSWLRYANNVKIEFPQLAHKMLDVVEDMNSESNMIIFADSNCADFSELKEYCYGESYTYSELLNLYDDLKKQVKTKRSEKKAKSKTPAKPRTVTVGDIEVPSVQLVYTVYKANDGYFFDDKTPSVPMTADLMVDALKENNIADENVFFFPAKYENYGAKAIVDLARLRKNNIAIVRPYGKIAESTYRKFEGLSWNYSHLGLIKELFIKESLAIHSDEYIAWCMASRGSKEWLNSALRNLYSTDNRYIAFPKSLEDFYLKNFDVSKTRFHDTIYGVNFILGYLEKEIEEFFDENPTDRYLIYGLVGCLDKESFVNSSWSHNSLPSEAKDEVRATLEKNLTERYYKALEYWRGMKNKGE